MDRRRVRNGGSGMRYARKEMTSAEQLVELRKARDRYNALADQFRDQGDPLAAMEERLKREQDARRIANAYEKSIANIVARSASMRQAQASGPTMGSLGVKIAVLGLFVLAAGVSLAAIERPEIYQRAFAFMPMPVRIFLPGSSPRQLPKPKIRLRRLRVLLRPYLLLKNNTL